MTIDTGGRAREKGIALVYVGVFLVPLLLCTGLAVDLGRGYLVRANLAKAVDAAALAAAHNITAADSSQAQRVADNIFHANFPLGFLGVNPSGPDMQTSFGSDGSHIITVASTAIVPTTFMRLAGRDSLRVAATATATRRLVDMAFVIDRSGAGSGDGVRGQIRSGRRSDRVDHVFLWHYGCDGEFEFRARLRSCCDRRRHRGHGPERSDCHGGGALSGLGSAPQCPVRQPIGVAHRGALHGRLAKLLPRPVPSDEPGPVRLHHLDVLSGESRRRHARHV